MDFNFQVSIQREQHSKQFVYWLKYVTPALFLLLTYRLALFKYSDQGLS